MVTCRLCDRECANSSQFCRYHLTARRNIDSAYKQWSEAYGSIGWNEYLTRIISSPETGKWAKEVASLLSKEPEIKDPKSR